MSGHFGAYSLGVLCLLWCVGCAAPVPYRYGHSLPAGSAQSIASERDGPVVIHGQENKTLDRLARIAGAPGRLIRLNKKINNHQVSPETLDKLRTYLVENDLTDVTILVNHYDPRDQWQRLKENRRVGAGWRYTLGTLNLLTYTLFPSRVFGGDGYNPFTNTMQVNSDLPAIALYEAAFAKNVHAHRRAGTYVALTGLPGVSIFRSGHELGDVLGYAGRKTIGNCSAQAYHVVYPQIGVETASLGMWMAPLWWEVPALSVGGAAVGHATGRIVAARWDEKIDAAPTDDSRRAREPVEGEARDRRRRCGAGRRNPTGSWRRFADQSGARAGGRRPGRVEWTWAVSQTGKPRSISHRYDERFP